MNSTSSLRLSFSLAAALFGAAGAQAQTVLACDRPGPQVGTCTLDTTLAKASGTKLRGVLLYEYNATSPHTTAKVSLNNALVRLSERYGFRLDRNSDSNYIREATLQGIDLVVFSNGDRDMLSSPASLQAMRNFVEQRGKALMGVHVAAAFITCPQEDLSRPDCGWLMRAFRTQYWVETSDNTPGRLYADSVLAGQIPPNATGAAAVPSAQNHGRRKVETEGIFKNLPVNGPSGPLANRPYIWEGVRDGWMNFRNVPRLEGQRVLDGVTYGPINVLLSLDETSLSPSACSNNNCNTGTFGDRSVSWTRKMGNGLAAFSSMGHSDVYTRARVVNGDSVRDSVVEKYTWRLMKYLARDFVGCMDPASPHYNAQATVARLTESDPVDPCFGTSALTLARASRLAGAELSMRAGVLRVAFAEPGAHDVRVSNVAGREVFSGAGRGALEVASLKPGIYFVRVSAPGRGATTLRARVL